MSHFYGSIKGTKGEATRCGDKRNGYRSVAAGWQGAVEVYLRHDEKTGKDFFSVHLIPWGCAGGYSILLAEGELDLAKVRAGDANLRFHAEQVERFRERLAKQAMLADWQQPQEIKWKLQERGAGRCRCCPCGDWS